MAAAAEEAEKRRKKAEEERQRKTKAAQEELHAIPLAGIKLAEDGPKRKSGFEEPKYSNITPKGSFESIVVIDMETTGLAPSKDRIIELAAVKFDNGRPVAAFHTFVNPEKPLSAEAQSIKGTNGAWVLMFSDDRTGSPNAKNAINLYCTQEGLEHIPDWAKGLNN